MSICWTFTIIFAECISHVSPFLVQIFNWFVTSFIFITFIALSLPLLKERNQIEE
jgi:hypothetical protein